MNFAVHLGDSIDVLRGLPENSVDSVVTDPPYGLSLMGKRWDYDVPRVALWAECLRILKPGGHLLAFAGTRTQHRMAVRIEDAGFEIRDMIAWVYSTGFPKSLDVSKAIDSLDRVEKSRQRSLQFTAWMRSTGITAVELNQATGTVMGSHYLTAAEQPAVATADLFDRIRPLIAARGLEVPAEVEELVRIRTTESENMKRRKILETVEAPDLSQHKPMAVAAQSIGKTERRTIHVTAAHTEAAQRWEGWGTALKPSLEPITVARKPPEGTIARNVLTYGTGALNIDATRFGEEDRFPPNLIHDGSPEAVRLFPSETSTGSTGEESAARFFYCPKPTREDRDDGLQHNGNTHPTVKPTDLMRYLCRLVTPPGGTVLDPFTGSGSTGRAAVLEGFRFIGVEREADFVEIARARIQAAIDRKTATNAGNLEPGQLPLFQ